MSARSFIDTNVLVYTDDADSPGKRQAALDLVDVLAAADLQIVHQLSYWDALILTSARRSGCSVLYTEDLASGTTLTGVEIRDPFA